jgi:hypothetical protein
LSLPCFSACLQGIWDKVRPLPLPLRWKSYYFVQAMPSWLCCIFFLPPIIPHFSILPFGNIYLLPNMFPCGNVCYKKQRVISVWFALFAHRRPGQKRCSHHRPFQPTECRKGSTTVLFKDAVIGLNAKQNVLMSPSRI